MADVKTYMQRADEAGLSVRTKEKLFDFALMEITDLRAALQAQQGDARTPAMTEAQRIEAAKQSDWCPHCGQGWHAATNEQKARVNSMRYLFLRKGFGDFGPDVDLHNAFVDGDERMDAAIDAAMLAARREG